ncbi:MAG: hypothetical protein AAGE98_06805 [Actinomycetota bacterium]
MASEPKLFKRRLFGYQRKAVDAHLATVDTGIADLQAKVEAASTPEQHELVLRATRLSVETVLEEAEADAERIRADARVEAEAIVADAYDLARAKDRVIDLTEDEAALFDGEPTAADLRVGD